MLSPTLKSIFFIKVFEYCYLHHDILFLTKTGVIGPEVISPGILYTIVRDVDIDNKLVLLIFQFCGAWSVI